MPRVVSSRNLTARLWPEFGDSHCQFHDTDYTEEQFLAEAAGFGFQPLPGRDQFLALVNRSLANPVDFQPQSPVESSSDPGLGRLKPKECPCRRMQLRALLNC